MIPCLFLFYAKNSLDKCKQWVSAKPKALIGQKVKKKAIFHDYAGPNVNAMDWQL